MRKDNKEREQLQGQLIWTIVYYNEFLNWYRYGVKYVKSSSCFVEKNELEGEISSEAEQFLKDNVIYYSYQEDYEVVIVLVRYNPEETVKENDCYRFTSFTIEQLYPISQRGKQLLSAGRIPDFIPLGEPIPEVEKTVKKLETKFQNEEALMGASNLSKMAANRIIEMKPGEEENYIKEDIKTAIIARNQQKEVPIKDGNFCENLFCYVRREPKFPDSDLGYFCDLGSILKRLQEVLDKQLSDTQKNDKNKISKALFFYFKAELLVYCLYYFAIQEYLTKLNNKYIQLLNNYKKQLTDYTKERKKLKTPSAKEVSLWDIVNSKKINIDDLQLLISDEYPVISCLIFLKLKAELYDSLTYSPKPLHETSFYDLITQLQHNHKSELLTGLWLVGAYCGYEHFADKFYEELKQPF